jgi:hypothetical protein
MYRWEKGDKFIEIELGQDAGNKGAVGIVSQNVLSDLPVEWRAMVQMSDNKKLSQLIASIESIARREGLKRK